MESEFRGHLMNWLRGDAFLAATLNAIEEESPVAATAPWLGIAASGAIDWSTKTLGGREVRVALELVDRTGEAGSTGFIAEAIERRIALLPDDETSFAIVATHFLRSRAERRPRGLRAVLLEYRFRLLARAAV